MGATGRRRLMILGAGKFQVPVIALAREMGFETVVVSPAGPYPGFACADRFHHLDVRDKDAILAVARSERICGILTDQTDLPVPTVAYVAERLGLPGVGYHRALTITNKARCREHCRAIGVPVPESIACGSGSEAAAAAERTGYPLVVKPPDSQGARGVVRVDHPAELPAAFREALAHSASGSVLVESLAPGRLIWTIGFVSAGRHTGLLLGDSDVFNLPGRFIHRQSIHPADIADEPRHRLRALDRLLFESLGVPFGMTFSQYVLDEETGRAWLIEAALRSAAGFTSSHLVPLARGLRPLPLLIEFATGSRTAADISVEDLPDRAVGTTYLMLLPGTIRRIVGLAELRGVPGVELVSLDDLEPGTRVSPVLDATDTRGPIVFSGATRLDCLATTDAVRATLRIDLDDDAGGRSGIRWR